MKSYYYSGLLCGRQVEQESNHITGVIEESSVTDAVDRIRSTYINQIVGLRLYEEVDLTELETVKSHD